MKKTRNSWTDTVGQVYQVGDYIAVASTAGRSPQMVIARVESINTHRADGTPIVVRGWDPETGQRFDRPTVTVTAKPVLDGRGFHRWSSKVYDPESRTFKPNPKGPRSVTYTLPGNILKLNEEAVTALIEKLMRDE